MENQEVRNKLKPETKISMHSKIPCVITFHDLKFIK